jgi:hypothetical protein
VVQQVLIVCFCESNNLRLFVKQWAVEFAGQQHAVSDCVFSTRSIHGSTFMDVASSMLAMLLVALSIKGEDMQSLSALYPCRERGVFMWSCVMFIWFIQCVYLPAVVGVSAATMLADSEDASDIVINALAVTFILEIDDMMYENLLSDQDRSVYLRTEDDLLSKCRRSEQDAVTYGEALSRMRLRMSTKTVHRSSWCLFLISYLVMMFTYCGIRFNRILPFDVFADVFTLYATIAYQSVYLLRWCIILVASNWDKTHGRQKLLVSVGYCGLGLIAMYVGWMWYFLWLNIMDGKPWYPGWTTNGIFSQCMSAAFPPVSSSK